MHRNLFLAASLLLCLTASSFGYVGKACSLTDRGCQRTESVPEGGSTVMYLAAAGLVCAGALSFRRRSKKEHLS